MTKVKLRCEFRKIPFARSAEVFAYGEVCERKVKHKEYGMYLCDYHYNFIKDLLWFIKQRKEGKIKSLREILERKNEIGELK
nr:MAG: hypothetical protein [Lokiarchaeota virus Ratatoskr Meg22_1012]